MSKLVAEEVEQSDLDKVWRSSLEIKFREASYSFLSHNFAVGTFVTQEVWPSDPGQGLEIGEVHQLARKETNKMLPEIVDRGFI